MRETAADGWCGRRPRMKAWCVKGRGTTTFLRWSGTATVRGLMALRWWILPIPCRALPTGALLCNCMPGAKEICSSKTYGFEICQSGEVGSIAKRHLNQLLGGPGGYGQL